MSSNERIVACARGWLGTRFHHQGRVKKTMAHKGGVDCLGLLIGIANELSLKSKAGIDLSSLDVADYSHYPDTTYLRLQLENALTSIPINLLAPGDVILMNVDGNPQHLGVISNQHGCMGLIHAYAPARSVTEHALDNFWQPRVEAAFRISF